MSSCGSLALDLWLMLCDSPHRRRSSWSRWASLCQWSPRWFSSLWRFASPCRSCSGSRPGPSHPAPHSHRTRSAHWPFKPILATNFLLTLALYSLREPGIMFLSWSMFVFCFSSLQNCFLNVYILIIFYLWLGDHTRTHLDCLYLHSPSSALLHQCEKILDFTISLAFAI